MKKNFRRLRLELNNLSIYNNMKVKLLVLAGILLFSLRGTSQDAPESSDKIMAEAYKLAAKEKKNVMIVFHASWCGWCKKFDASVNDPSCKAYFDKSFVIRHLDILEQPDKKNLENPGATELFNKNGGQGSGIPFFLIYDKNGVLLADSKIRAEGEGPDKPGKNMGCPASDDEVAAFIKLLKKTSKISDAEITAVTERFKKNR
jgi:thiol-disulfide isomerase/thioredoxin